MLAPATDRIASTLTATEAEQTAWQVVIVGAGTAGLVAAREAALAGARTLLIEKQSHPRPKVCGGCLGHAAVQMLQRQGLANVVLGAGGVVTDRLWLRSAHRAARVALPSGISVSRHLLDATLLKEALAAGASYLDHTGARLASTDHRQCRVELKQVGGSTLLRTDMLLVADGIAGDTLRDQAGTSAVVHDKSHVGVGALLEAESVHAGDLVESGSIAMHCGQQGYVGLVQVESGRLNVAAALSPAALRAEGSAAGAVCTVLESTGVRVPPALREARYSGTPALTRKRSRVSLPRVFVLGDATGYVEPFTGEGMTWAIHSALLAVPLALEGVAEWHAGLAKRWEALHEKQVRRRQRVCRMTSAIVRRPWLRDPLIRLMQGQPTMSAAVIRRAVAAPRDRLRSGRLFPSKHSAQRGVQ